MRDHDSAVRRVPTTFTESGTVEALVREVLRGGVTYHRGRSGPRPRICLSREPPAGKAAMDC